MWACLRSWLSRQFFNIAHSRRIWSRRSTSRYERDDARSNGDVRSGWSQIIRACERRSKMSFKLSQRSRDRLEGVDVGLIAVVDYAITVTKVDFGVICGLRTIEEQRKLVNAGASKTMKSKHIGGNAVDLMAYIGSRGSWELNLYDDLADAMKEGAKAAGVGVRWGAAWHIPDIRDWDGTMEEAMNAYIDLRRSQGKRPFIDGPHFELML